MKHLIRSIKYFFYFAFLTTAIVLVLVLIGAVGNNISDIFEEGWGSIWKIAIFFAVIAAIYPKFAFISRSLDIQADWDQTRGEAVRYFRERGLNLETETSDKLTFRFRSAAGRISRMGEDRITLSRTDEGYVLDGMRKDVLVFSTGLEARLSKMPNDC